MPLTVGQTLSFYEVLGSLGAGAMGEVYRAKDTRLGREVAIKVLPEHFADEPERLARFEREARSLASLNHPNIAQIYGVDQVGDTCFLALELVPGEELAERLRRGPLPVGEALDVCRQIAAGLEAAHEAGVIHRDLKPANVRVTPDGKVKLLDFGLAKPSGAAGESPSTIDSVLATEAGRLLGTPTYMAPEQARGKPIDRRVDVWAFGCVLYECLTGKRAFDGGTMSDVLGAVLHTEPDLARLPAGTPARVVELVERCLRKDAASRLRDVGDARVLLEELGGRLASPASAGAEGEAGGARSPWRAVAAGVAGIALGVLGVLALRRAPAPPPATGSALQVVMAIPEFDSLVDGFAAAPTISRDGRWVAYSGGERLHVRSLERLDDRVVPGSENADGMFWSPGSDALGFSKDGRLWAWPLDRSECRSIGALPMTSEFNGGVWMPDGAIYFSLFTGDLYAMPAAGGEAEVVLARAAGEVDFHIPAPLPGGDEFVSVAHRTTGKQELFVFSTAERRRVPVLMMDELSVAAWSPTGHLLLMRNWTTQDIWAVRYSPEERRVEGEPFPFEQGVQHPSVADDGSMVCVQGDRESLFDLLWVSRDGLVSLVPGGPFRGLSDPALSPDDRRIAYSAVTDDNRDVWVLDVARGTSSRLTSARTNDDQPRWSADGETIFFMTTLPGQGSLWRVDADGASAPVLVADDASSQPTPLADGRAVLYQKEGMDDLGIYRLGLEPGAEAASFLPSASRIDQMAASPDGRWLAYRGNETGRSEVFLRRLPAGDAKQQVSIGGGELPMWGRDGAALYYLHGAELMEVAVAGGTDAKPGLPQRILNLRDLGLGLTDNARRLVGFGLTADGERFLVARRSPADPRAGILYSRGISPAPR